LTGTLDPLWKFLNLQILVVNPCASIRINTESGGLGAVTWWKLASITLEWFLQFPFIILTNLSMGPTTIAREYSGIDSWTYLRTLRDNDVDGTESIQIIRPDFTQIHLNIYRKMLKE
tara:strand:+ start:137 stop:487 length:351 start_codon:yes stop_codon:yes gene_type:complete